jgi:hypothetical protein
MESAEGVHWAEPFERASGPQIVAPLSLNVTFPATMSSAAVATSAVNVTDCPKSDGLALELTPVAVATSEDSNAPIAGGEGRVTPSRSVAGTPVTLPAPRAGEFVRSLRLVAEWKSGSLVRNALPRVSPELASPFTVLPKKTLLRTDGELGAVTAPADETCGVPPVPDVAALPAKMSFATVGAGLPPAQTAPAVPPPPFPEPLEAVPPLPPIARLLPNELLKIEPEPAK